MILLIILFILSCLGYYFEVGFDYIEENNLFLIFFTAKKTRERKCIKIRLWK
jgi:hypothetical protein